MRRPAGWRHLLPKCLLFRLLTRIVVSDLRGHGEQVSHLSQWVYEALRDNMNSLDGAAILEWLNSPVHAHGFQTLTTAAVIGFYLGNSHLHFCPAGHPPLLLRRQNDQAWNPVPLTSGPR
ncbi:MAG: SpoIIE family protein phosphatase [Bryobacteraceae bacterium]